MKKYIFVTLMTLIGCTPKSDSLEGIADEVIKKHSGIDIEFKPISQDNEKK